MLIVGSFHSLIHLHSGNSWGSHQLSDSTWTHWMHFWSKGHAARGIPMGSETSLGPVQGKQRGILYPGDSKGCWRDRNAAETGCSWSGQQDEEVCCPGVGLISWATWAWSYEPESSRAGARCGLFSFHCWDSAPRGYFQINQCIILPASLPMR